ncbi:TerL [Vibrio sp. 99-8-1]|nr:TerL [Vibrio sp. 99-8-1]
MRIKYIASPTFKTKVHRLRPLVTAIRGPIGSGKSVGCVMHMKKIAMEQEPNEDGVRKTRWVCIRNTYPDLKGTVIKTFQDWLPQSICPIVYDAPIRAMWKQHHPDGKTRIECEFFFLSLDKPKDISKLMSLECTGVWINEAQFMPKAIVLEALSRAGRYPSMRDGGPTWYGMIMDTNSPDDDHWWYDFEEGIDEETGKRLCPDNWEFVVQPAGITEISGIPEGALSKDQREMIRKGLFVDYLGKRFVANPDAENVANHKNGFGYWLEKVQGQTLNWIRSRMCNVFATVADGKPVFGDSFNREIHVSANKLLPVKGWTTLVGLDFGLTPAATFIQISPVGQVRVIDEVVSESMGIERFAEEQLKPLIASKYQGCDVKFFGDPAGVQRAQTNETTCFEILEEAGFDVQPAHSNVITARLEAVRYFLHRLIGRGQPQIVISPHCRQLIKGMETGYQYKRMNVSGQEKYSDKPDKNMYSHLNDSFQYVCLAAMPQLHRENVIKQASTGHKALNTTTGY